MKKDKTLTTRFDLQTMAELSAAVEILSFRSINALVHQMVHQKINEAKKLVAPEEFQTLVETHKRETLSRSEKKSKEYAEKASSVEILGKLAPASDAGLPFIEIEVGAKRKKRKRVG